MSRLETISKEFRECTLVMNSCRYTCGNQYCTGSNDVISDGDCRGRDPKAEGASIGTNCDISERVKQLKKNAARYTPTHQYC